MHKMHSLAGVAASALLRVWNEPRSLTHDATDGVTVANVGAAFDGFELKAVRNASC